METLTYMHVAYAATWLIHLGYIATLVTRYRALKRDVEDLKRK
jgi:CcmD family protein